MKRAIIYSLLLHVLFIVLAFWIVRTRVVKEPEPFVATIITPEEAPQPKNYFRMPRLPKNLPAPKKFSAIPSSPKPARRSKLPAFGNSALPPDTGRSTAREEPQKQQPGSTAESTRTQQEQGMAQEQQTPSVNGKGGGVLSGTGQRPSTGRTAREKLFDKDIIAKLTPREKNTTSKDNAITFDTKEYKYYGYMQRLREKIEGAWKFPSEAAEKNINGDLYIRFTIKKDGRLSRVELMRTSGYKFLDDAAIDALRDADPYWPLPDEWKEDSFTITGHFVYYYYNTYIR